MWPDVEIQIFKNYPNVAKVHLGNGVFLKTAQNVTKDSDFYLLQKMCHQEFSKINLSGCTENVKEMYFYFIRKSIFPKMKTFYTFMPCVQTFDVEVYVQNVT